MATFKLKIAKHSDFKQLINFYDREHSDLLPAPSPRDLGFAITNGELLMVTDPTGTVVATAATFEITPPTAKDIVAELAGTRVTRRVGGTEPLRLQGLLIVIRTLLFALPLAETLQRHVGNCLIVSVKNSNLRSKQNVVACGFLPLEGRPDWLLYHEVSWIGKAGADQWEHFYATADTVQTCCQLFLTHDLQTAHIALTAGGHHIDLQLELPGLAMYRREISEIADGTMHIQLSRPPANIILRRDDELA